MIVAELEIYHSRPIAPTRRISLGNRNLPVAPAPGLGGLLLAGVVAEFAPLVAADLREDLWNFFDSLDTRAEITQPQVRHRFQEDRVGLSLSSQTLRSEGGFFQFDFTSDLARPVQLVLGSLYAAAFLPKSVQAPIFDCIRIAFAWEKKVDQNFVDKIFSGDINQNGRNLSDWTDPVGWALKVLEITRTADGMLPSRRIVQKQFRRLLRIAHPDQGGVDGISAGDRIADLSDARSILLSKES